VERGSLIRVRALCDLLVQTLEGLDDEALKSAQLLEELRALGSRAAQELDQLEDLGSE
jgi:hypothetical protein